MDWTGQLAYLEASIALLLIMRVHLLGLRSVRATLLFLLLPDTLAPLTFFFARVARVDYRILWIGFEVLDWVCLVGLAARGAM
jgi:hypothetical protein